MQWRKLSVVKNQFDPRLPWLGASNRPATEIAEYNPIDNSNNPIDSSNKQVNDRVKVITPDGKSPFQGGFTRGGGAGRYSPEKNKQIKEQKLKEQEIALTEEEMEKIFNRTKNAMSASRAMWATALHTKVDADDKLIAIVDLVNEKVRDAVAELVRRLLGDIREGADYVGELPAKEAAGYLSLADGVLSGHSKLKKGSHITIPSKLTGGIEVWIK